MSSHSIHLYASAPDAIATYLQSKDLRSLIDEIGRHANGNHPRSEMTWALQCVLSGQYEADQVDPQTGEHPRGNELIRAFEGVCALVAGKPAVIELDLDEEATPTLWRFVWEAGVVPFDIPLSPFGSPAVSWLNPEQVKWFHSDFEGDLEKGGYPTSYLREDELRRIVECLSNARSAGYGLFVFYES